MENTGKFVHELEPGDECAPLEYSVSVDLNQQFCFAQEDFDPRYIEGIGGKPPLVHPTILLQMAADTRSPSYRLAPGTGSILGKAEEEFLHPVVIGTRLTVTWRVTDRYEKRGRHYHVMVAETRDDDGRVVLRRTLHLTFNKRDTRTEK